MDMVAMLPTWPVIGVRPTLQPPSPQPPAEAEPGNASRALVTSKNKAV